MFSFYIQSSLRIDDKGSQGMATRFVLTVAIFQLAIRGCYAVNGIIWRKQHQEFVQLFSIPQFAALQEENLAKRRAIEMPDMSGEVVKAVYYEVKNFQHKFSNTFRRAQHTAFLLLLYVICYMLML